MDITRRKFLKGAAVAAGAIGLAGTGLTLKQAKAEGTDTQWDAEYDVIVVGYGAAGANAAIVAADKGASVLLTEKCEEGLEGGNTKVSGQGLQCFEGKENAIVYYKSLRGFFNTPSDAVIEAYADKVEEMREWLIHLGADPNNLDNYRGTGEPWRSKGEYPELTGAGHMLYYCVSGSSFDGAYYYLLQDNIDARRDKIDLWYEAPAKHLIQNPETKVIEGVQIEKEGKLLNVRAKNGVVMCTGGFENNQDMVQSYLQQPYVFPYGSLENTGDGIKMCQEVKANLWHMSNAAGFLWCYKAPNASRAQPFRAASKGIFIGPSGERYMDETQSTRHGRIYFAGRYIQMPSPLPAYFICDQAALSSGKLYASFSDNNEEEIANGWFIKGDTIEELADKIFEQLPAEVLRPCAATPFQENFKKTIDKWNASCEKGEDERYERPANTLTPIKEGPFYALEIGIQMYNTQGGPERNEKGEVIDLDGNPIPHLYSAGELGAIWSDAYNGGGNLGECTAFGRIAGENAAEPKND